MRFTADHLLHAAADILAILPLSLHLGAWVGGCDDDMYGSWGTTGTSKEVGVAPFNSTHNRNPTDVSRSHLGDAGGKEIV